MKVKTSITLPRELLRKIDGIIKGHTNRSVFIEQALQNYLKQMERDQRNRDDLQKLNKHADQLNREARDVISYQVEL